MRHSSSIQQHLIKESLYFKTRANKREPTRCPRVYMRVGSFSGGTHATQKGPQRRTRSRLRPGDAVRGRRDSWRPGQRRGRPSATSFRGWEAARVTSAPGGANLAKSGARRDGHQPPAFPTLFVFLFAPFFAEKQRAAPAQLLLASRITFHVPLCLLSPVLVGTEWPG